MKGDRFLESKRKDKAAEKEGKREGRKAGANVYKRPAWKTLQWTLSLTLVKCAPFFPFFLRSPSSSKFPPCAPSAASLFFNLHPAVKTLELFRFASISIVCYQDGTLTIRNSSSPVSFAPLILSNSNFVTSVQV